MIKLFLAFIVSVTALTGCMVVPVYTEYRTPIVPEVVVPVYRNPYYVYERPVYITPGVGWRYYYHR